MDLSMWFMTSERIRPQTRTIMRDAYVGTSGKVAPLCWYGQSIGATKSIQPYVAVETNRKKAGNPTRNCACIIKKN